MTPEYLIAFEERVTQAKRDKHIHQPIHLSGGNEEQLIKLFNDWVKPEDWVFSTYRNHYHALLHGIPEQEVFSQILSGRSMTPLYAGRRFFTSALVGGCLPIAVGTAAGLKRLGKPEWVWCFVGDMAASGGAFHEARRYASGHALPITFVIEDNGLSCDTPTSSTWGNETGTKRPLVLDYSYSRTQPHQGARDAVL